jgi:hypothetical protein
MTPTIGVIRVAMDALAGGSLRNAANQQR